MEESALPLKAYYYCYPNFGDLLNELIPPACFGLETEFAEFTDAEIVMLGSILDKLLNNGTIGAFDRSKQNKADRENPIHVWGTGLMYQYEGTEQEAIRPLEIHALRGELTRIQLSRILDRNVDCVLADPGLLAPQIVPAGKKKWDVGIVPHYVDAADPVFARMQDYYSNACLIDVHADPRTVLEQISQCRCVFSTSLHGIVTADAYNIPNCWCKASEKILGNDYKYYDYFSSFGTERQPFDLRSGNLPDPDKQCATSFRFYRSVIKKQKALLQCFPFFEQPSWQEKFKAFIGLS